MGDPIYHQDPRHDHEPSEMRRSLLRAGLLGGVSLATGGMLTTLAGCASTAMREGVGFAPPVGGSGFAASGWEDYPRLLARIKAPTFPARDFSITQFGAVADGRSDATEAIAQAIAACNAAGGGRVVVPAGEFLTGPIVLKSNVNLHVSAGATLKFSTDPDKYPLVFTRWEGIECMNYSPLIYAFEQENIAVTGKGTLDGQAARENWWDWKLTVRSNSSKSSGLKSRPGNCPYAPVA